MKMGEHVSKRYIRSVFLLSSAGLVISGYLAYVHAMTHLDPLFTSACTISQKFDCETVAQSPYAIFSGLPWAHWGILYYALCLTLFSSLRAANRSELIPIAMLPLGSLHVGFSLYLSHLSLTTIGVFCPLCLADHLIGLIFFINGVMELFRGGLSAWHKNASALLAFILYRRALYLPLFFLVTIFVAVRLFVPPYWHIPPSVLNLDGIQTGVTSDGHQWIGAREPIITIEEYTDYRCFHCRKLHYQVRALIARHPDAIRLVHRHYPLDHFYNPIVEVGHTRQGSGKLALVAIAAADFGKFWPMNDNLYQLAARHIKAVNLQELADFIDVPADDYVAAYSSNTSREKLRLDIISGIKNEISATPTYIIAGKVYAGMLPMDEIKKILAVEQPP
jgi:uncharacterized membrane protein/protein-disulfide isomerase